MPPKKAKSSPKQPAIYRQKRQNGQDTAFTLIDGQRIHLGTYGTTEAETKYRRAVAEWNADIVVPKTNTADIIVAELVLRLLKEREGKVSQSSGIRNSESVPYSLPFMATLMPRRST